MVANEATMTESVASGGLALLAAGAVIAASGIQFCDCNYSFYCEEGKWLNTGLSSSHTVCLNQSRRIPHEIDKVKTSKGVPAE